MDNWMIIVIPAGILTLLGIIFWSIGFFMTRKTRDWEKTTGEIVKKSRWGGGLPDYRPTVRFEAHDGQTYEVMSFINQTPGLLPGRKVPVLYDPYDPYRARIDTFVQSGRIFLIIGNVLLGLGIAIALIIRAFI